MGVWPWVLPSHRTVALARVSGTCRSDTWSGRIGRGVEVSHRGKGCQPRYVVKRLDTVESSEEVR